MLNPVMGFIVIAILAAIFLWALAQFPSADATVVKFIRVAVIVLLSVMLLNLILFVLFGKGIGAFLGS